jgi:hypothetical protein
MSTLVAQNISNGVLSTSTANVINGAKAWVNFNGTGTVAIRASFNVSSITDNGTGNYTVNFTNAMPDANYATQIGVSDISWGAFGTTINADFTTTTTVRVITFFGSSNTSNNGDPLYVAVSIFR